MKIIKKITNYLPFLLLFLTIVIFFNKFFFPSISAIVTPDLESSDLMHGYYPIRNLLSESLKNNEILLWTKNIATGYPIFADGQIGSFNFINLIMCKFFPFIWAVNITYLITFFIAGAGTYLFARELKLNKMLSFFSGIIFTFSGFNITQINHISLLQGISFLPLELFLIEKLIKQLNESKIKKTFLKEKNILLFLSIIFSQQILSGHQQMTLYSIFTCTIYIIVRSFFLKKNITAKFKLLLFTILLLSFSFIISILLSSILILPSFELFNLSLRTKGMVNYDFFSFPFKNLSTFINPYFFGNPKYETITILEKTKAIFWENTGYVGIIPIISVFISLLFIKKNKLIISFLLIFILSILLITGNYSPLNFIFKIPPFNFFRVPSRFLFLTDLTLAIIASLTIKELVKNILKRNQIIIIAIIIAFQIGNIFYYFFNYHVYLNKKILLEIPKISKFIQNDKNSRVYTIENSNNWKKIFLFNGWQDYAEYLPFKEGLIGNSSFFYDINKSNYYVNFETERMTIINQIIKESIIEKKGSNLFFSNSSKKILDLQSNKYIITPIEFNLPQFSLLFKTERYALYENKNFIQRARMVYKYKTASSLEEAKNIIISKDFEPKKEIVLEKIPVNNKNENNITENNSDKIIWQKDNDQNIKLKIKTNKNGFLVLSDTYFPGWKAYIDNKQTEIFPANINQKAIQIEKGTHIINFIYFPDSYKIGSIITLLSYSMVVFFIILQSRKTN